MSGTSLNALHFLISCVFDFYIMVLFVRLVLAWVHADYNHPITQFIIKMTSFAVKPLKKFLPDFHNLETATLVLILIVEMIKFFIRSLLIYGVPNILGLFILAIGDSIGNLLNILAFALLIQVLLSWTQPHSQAYQLLNKFTSPLMKPLQRFIPPVGGVDLSPIPAIIILQLLIIILVQPILGIGWGIAAGA